MRAVLIAFLVIFCICTFVAQVLPSVSFFGYGWINIMIICSNVAFNGAFVTVCAMHAARGTKFAWLLFLAALLEGLSAVAYYVVGWILSGSIPRIWIASLVFACLQIGSSIACIILTARSPLSETAVHSLPKSYILFFVFAVVNLCCSLAEQIFVFIQFNFNGAISLIVDFFLNFEFLALFLLPLIILCSAVSSEQAFVFFLTGLLMAISLMIALAPILASFIFALDYPIVAEKLVPAVLSLASLSFSLFACVGIMIVSWPISRRGRQDHAQSMEAPYAYSSLNHASPIVPSNEYVK